MLVAGRTFPCSSHFQNAITLGYHAPGLFPEVFSAVRDSIRTQILEDSPEPSSDIDRGSVEFSVATVYPGALTPVINEAQIWEWP